LNEIDDCVLWCVPVTLLAENIEFIYCNVITKIQGSLSGMDHLVTALRRVFAFPPCSLARSLSYSLITSLAHPTMSQQSQPHHHDISPAHSISTNQDACLY
jgi:hypothetical protein